MPTTLEPEEKEQLQDRIDEKIDRLKSVVEKKYVDDDYSAMMDPDLHKMRNEIMRRIKLSQLKKLKMPNFVRTAKDTIIKERKKDELRPIDDELERELLEAIEVSPLYKKMSSVIGHKREAVNAFRREFTGYVK